jgi:AcrR family transcriptional regulator
MATRRARSDEDKLARRSEILDAARSVFDAGEVDAFTMDAVAAGLDLAKGTLYRYFPTREGLLLALADDEYEQLFRRIDAALEHDAPAAVDARVDELSQILVDQLTAQPRFLRLAALVPSVLERNIPFETALSYKCNVVERSTRTCRTVATWLGVDDVRAVRLLMQLQAVAIGLHHAVNPAPIIVRVLADPAFRGRRVDLSAELAHAARALVRGALSV